MQALHLLIECVKECFSLLVLRSKDPSRAFYPIGSFLRAAMSWLVLSLFLVMFLASISTPSCTRTANSTNRPINPNQVDIKGRKL